jgi:hypothetical protein
MTAERRVNQPVQTTQLSHRALMIGARGALLQSCIDKYIPLYRNRVFFEQNPNLFPVDSNGKLSTDRVSQLVDMFFDPSRVPAGFTIRNTNLAINWRGA